MPSADAKTLSLWLSFWTEEQKLAAAGELPDLLPKEITPPDSKMVAPFDSPDLWEGEIRVIDPWLVRDVRGPLYFIILKKWIGDLWLIAPFSRFPVPATVGEWETGREHDLLSVLSLWNAHTVPTHILQRSWFVATFAPGELAAAMAVFRHVATGISLPARIQERVGPPLFHPADPRHDYLAEDAAALRPLAELAAAYVETAAISGEQEGELDFLVPSAFGRSKFEFALAAASDGGVTFVIRVSALALRVTFRQSVDSEQVMARVVDLSTGQRTTKLDGGAVVRQGKVVGKFHDGRAEFTAAELTGDIALRDSNGATLRIEIEGSSESP